MNTGRPRRVVEIAAREAKWGRTLPKGHGLGIAAHYSFASYIAAVVEVAVDDRGGLTITRVDVAVDCGASINGVERAVRKEVLAVLKKLPHGLHATA